MFDLVPKILASAASFLFPIFASYKALKTSDPAQLRPWLMYWVVFSAALLVESWFDWILFWVPFYSYMRLFFLLYLVLPQTQGARLIYQDHFHPWLESNETDIEEFIGSLHERLRTAGLAYAKQAVEYIKGYMGLPPTEERQPEPAPSGQHPGTWYTQALLARFNLPSAGWTSGGATAPAAAQPSSSTTSDFYNLLQAAVSAATAAMPRSSSTTDKDSKDALSQSQSLIPDTIRGPSAKMSFIAAQRERLHILLSALDREATQVQTEEAMGSSIRAPSMSLDGPNSGGSSGEGSSSRPSSGLSKSRSEQDFVKLEAESGEEEDETGTVRRRAPATPGGGAAGGWMPWNWGAGGSQEQGKSSGVEQ